MSDFSIIVLGFFNLFPSFSFYFVALKFSLCFAIKAAFIFTLAYTHFIT